MLRRLRPVVWLLALCSSLVLAQEATELSGTLKRVKDTGVVILGYRDTAFPFSHAGRKNAPQGYTIDLCLKIVDEIRRELDRDAIAVQFRHVSSEERLAAVKEGRIDLECGSTTNNHVRQREVAFSPVIFVTGTKLLVRRSDGIRSYQDLRHRAVSVSAGTTNEAALRRLSDEQGLEIRVLAQPDLKQAFDLFLAGKATAFATDEVLLRGFLAHAKDRSRLAVVGEFLSYEPYGIVYRKGDPQLARVVERTFTNLAVSREIRWIYERWFTRRLPTGEQLDLPMNPQMTAIFEALGLPE